MTTSWTNYWLKWWVLPVEYCSIPEWAVGLGLLAGQSSIKSMLFVLRKFTLSLAVWEVALSCWKIEMLALLWNRRDERECHRGTVEHLNCHQWRLVANDNHGQWLPRSWQNPHPRNDLVQEHNSPHSVHISYGTRSSLPSPRCKENLNSSEKRTVFQRRRIQRVCTRVHLSSPWVTAPGFLSRYLSGPLSYVWCHITVNKMCWVRRSNKTFPSFKNVYKIWLNIKLFETLYNTSTDYEKLCLCQINIHTIFLVLRSKNYLGVWK